MPPRSDRPTRGSRSPRSITLLAIAIPGLAALLLFQYIPLLGNVIAFKSYQPYLTIGEAPWVGLDNFRALFEPGNGFVHAIGNTLILALIQSVLVFPVPLLLALLINSVIQPFTKRLIQSILYLPHFLSWVIVVAIFQQVLGNVGMLNQFLAQFDLHANILGNPEWFRVLLTSQVIWKDAGWGTIIFLAAISRVDTEQYEAAAVDGAGRWRRLWHITLPSLKGLFILLFILRLGSSLSVGFEQILLQEAAVGRDTSEVIDTWVYNNILSGQDWGASFAANMLKTIIGVILVVGANKLAHLFGERGVYEK